MRELGSIHPTSLQEARSRVSTRRAFLKSTMGVTLAGLATRTGKAAQNPALELLSHDALGLAGLVKSGELKPIELVEEVIRRIEETNPRLNAVITKMYDQARAAAASPAGGPFQGVPFLLKDLGAQYGGVRMTSGSRALADFIAPVDTELVIRQKRAGLIVVGKTNTPEFGLTATTEPHLFGATHNPWNLGHTPGGSSGGSAAAVAARIVPMAHANDGGGSIRIPASCCGLFGLKPTRARNSLGPHLGDIMSGMVAEHAVTISVRDSAALLDATAGWIPGDPYAAPPQERPFLEETSIPPGRLRVAFVTATPAGTPIHSDCVAAVQETARLLESLGHRVEEQSPSINGQQFGAAFRTVWLAGASWTLHGVNRMRGRPAAASDFEPFTWEFMQQGAEIKAGDYLIAVTYLQSVAREMARFLSQYDLWLTATIAEPPPRLGTIHPGPSDPSSDSARILGRLLDLVPYTPIANATGQPAMSVPLHWNQEGLPIGVHFVGRFGDEATLFRLAAQLEQARPWKSRIPPLSASAG